MSFNSEYQVTGTNNKDATTTILTCENEQGNKVTVEIDPQEVFINMIENLGNDQSHALAMIDWLNEQLN